MGPLKGITIVEIAGIGPGPFAAMMLSDMGAEVIRVERPGGGMFSSGDINPKLDVLNRGKRCICVDLKKPDGVETVLQLIEKADGLVEGFRPGVMEKLGLSPEICLERNPRLVFGRMTGWGQEGPLSKVAGHDLNYISIAGALHPIGRAGEKPAVPLNLVGDFGGGGLMMAYGMVCGLLETKTSGKGQVVDAAMVDGAAALMISTFAAQQSGFWVEERGTNMLDSGAHFYEVYETKDGKYVSIGSIEPQFYAVLMEKLGEDAKGLEQQYDGANWPAMKEQLSEVFKKKTRDEWTDLLEGSDACFAPVLAMSEAKDHPHNVARGSFVEDEGVWQPRPAPRFSRTDPETIMDAEVLGASTREVLAEYGFSDEDIAAKLEAGVIAASD